jgi:hypothetical protein
MRREAAAPGADRAVAHRPGPGRHVPFWLHQLVEYMLGAGLVWAGARVEGDGRYVAFALGGALFVFSAISDGGLGAGRLVSRAVHRVGDLVFVVAIPVAFVAAPSARTGILLVPGGASVVMLVYLWRRTCYDRRPRGAGTLAATVQRARDRVRADDGASVARRAGRIVGGDGSPLARRTGRVLGRVRSSRSGRSNGSGLSNGSIGSGLSNGSGLSDQVDRSGRSHGEGE